MDMTDMVTTGGGALLALVTSVVQVRAVQIAITLLLGAFFALLLAFFGVVLVWLALLLWAGAGREWTEGDEEELGMDEDEVYDPVQVTLAAATAVFANLFALASSLVGSAVNAIIQNLVLIAAFLLFFGAWFAWTAWMGTIMMALVRPWNCFFAPLWRTLVVPLVESVAFLISSFFLPALAIVSRIVKELTTTALLRAIECAFDTVVAILTLLANAVAQFALALVMWLRFPVSEGGNGFSPLVVGPDFFPPAKTLGSAINATSALADCLCEPLAEPVFDPIFAPFTGDPFASAINATGGIVITFLTQVILRPIVETVRARADQPDAGLEDIITRPNFNSTFDLAAAILNNGTQFVDSFVPAFYVSLSELLIDLFNLPLPINVVPPQRGFFTIVYAAAPNTFVLQPLKIFLNFLVNLDVVFTTADGLLFWRLDDAFNAAREYGAVITDYMQFLADWLRALGVNVEPLERTPIGSPRGKLSSVPTLERRVLVYPQGAVPAAVRRLAPPSLGHGDYVLLATKFDDDALHRRQIDDLKRGAARELQTEGELLKLGLDYFASVLERSKCFVTATIEAIVQIWRVVTEVPVGTIYRAIATAGDFPVPINPLLFSQEYWGDFRTRRCLVTRVPSALVTIGVWSIKSRDCVEDRQFFALCNETAYTGTIPPDAPTTRLFDIASPTELATLALGCTQNPLFPTVCVPALISPLPQPPNEWEVAIDAGVEVVRCVSLLVPLFCPDCALSDAGDTLAEFLTSLILIPLDIIVHIDRAVTTVYLGECVQWERPLDALTATGLVLSNLVRTIGNTLSDSEVCPILAAPDADQADRSSNFFCCIANALDSLVALIVEPLKQIVLALRGIILVLADVAAGGDLNAEVRDILDAISLESTFVAVENLIFDVLCVPLQLIPSTLRCDEDPDTMVRTVFTNATANILADVVLLTPKIALNTTLALVESLDVAFGGSPEEAVGNVTAALLLPLIDLGATLFEQTGRVLVCVDKQSKIGDALIEIADFLLLVGEELITLFTLLALLFIQLIFGLFQLFTEACEKPPCTAILEDALNTLGAVFVQIGIILFGKNFVCGVQDAGCFFSAATASQPVITTCIENNYTFVFCSAFADRPTKVTCEFAQPSKCFFGGCPDFPWGCCSDNPFPLPNGNGTVFNTLLAGGDTRDPSCSPWAGVEDDDSDQIEVTCADIPALGPPISGTIFEPYSLFYFGNATGHELECSFGQSSRSDCDVFRFNDVCNDVEFYERGTLTPVSRRKRALYEYGARERHNGATLNARFCIDYLDREYGLSRARKLSDETRGQLSQMRKNDRTAVRCYRGLLRDDEARRFAHFQVERQNEFDRLLKRAGPMDNLVRTFGAHRVRATHLYATQQQRARISTAASIHTLARRQHTRRTHERPYHPRLASTLKRLWTRAHDMAAHAQSHESRMAMAALGSRPRTKQIVSHMASHFADSNRNARKRVRAQYERLLRGGMAVAMHVSDAIEDAPRSSSRILERVDDAMTSRRSAVLSFARRQSSPFADGRSVLQQSLRGVRDYVGVQWRHVSRGLAKRFRTIINIRNKRAAWIAIQKRRGIRAPDNWRFEVRRLPLNVTQRVSALLHRGRTRAPFEVAQMPPPIFERECSTDVQLFCTNCTLLNDVWLAIELSFNSSSRFYAERGGGFDAILAQYVKVIDDTLVDPVGSDTYTTSPKTTPFLLDRVFGIRWFWLWDYTEFIELLFGPDGPPDDGSADSFVGATFNSSVAIAEAQGRPDLDNELYVIFEPFVVPVVTVFERFVGAISAAGPVDALVRIFERYVVCDYDRAIYCTSDLGIGLFDALANVLLVIGLISLALSIVPGSLFFIIILYSIVLPFAVAWIAYGTSPLCTFASIVGGFPALPVCLASDIAQLFSELTPQCPPQPIGLIAPDALEQASTQLCAVCADPIPLVPCSAAAGFLDGFDNVFYTLGEVLERSTVLSIGTALGTLVPRALAAALLYTPAYIESLNANACIGAICNLLTVGNVFALVVVLALIAAFGISSIVLLSSLFIWILFFIYLALYAMNRLWQQQQRGFVVRYQGARKPKTE